MADLSVDFCGFRLLNPFLLASAPPTATGAMIRRAYQAGWAGAVTKTLVMDASSVVNLTPRLASLSYTGEGGELKRIFAFENVELVTDRPLEVWLEEIEALVKEFPDRLTIASIMDDASRPDGWQEMARLCEQAGAKAVEINMSCPHGMPERGMGMAIGQHADLAGQVTRWVREAVEVPVIVKMTPNVTDVTIVAQECLTAGADAISAVNTVAAIMGVDLETMTPLPNVWGASTPGGMSGPAIKPIALRAVAAIAQTLKAPLSGIGGISGWHDAVEFLALGANHVQICSAVMARGCGIIDELVEGLENFLAEKGFASVADLIGSALPNLKSFNDLDAKRRVAARIDASLCLACDACRVSCLDSGYQAILRRKDGTYEVNTKKCTGCSLCFHVCPVEGCISMVAQI